MPGRFPLLTDEHVRGPLTSGLVRLGWDVVRAVDVFGERTSDELLFAYAAERGRVMVTSDEPLEAIALTWLREGRHFSGLLCWRQRLQLRLTDGDFIRRFEALAAMEAPFHACPIIHITALFPAV